MKLIRTALDRLYKVKLLSKFKPVLDAADEFFFSPEEITAGPPHVVDNLEIKRYMSTVIIALIPAAAASVYFFGLKALMLIAVSYIFGGIVEVGFAIARKGEINEGFLVTGLIYPLLLPPTVPLWVAAVGIVFGVFFGKEVFGGTGKNIFNPALVGRLFITIAFPAIMTSSWLHPVTAAVTSATPLGIFKTAGEVTLYSSLLLGKVPGSMGEIFRIGIILGGVFLMLTRVSNWRVPVSYLGAVFISGLIGNFLIPGKVAPPLFQILAGGLLLGAFFMATDPVTSPFTRVGKFIYGAGCGIFTVLIRSFSGFVEGVMFSIVLMNALAPLIDHLVLKMQYKPVIKK